MQMLTAAAKAAVVLETKSICRFWLVDVFQYRYFITFYHLDMDEILTQVLESDTSACYT